MSMSKEEHAEIVKKQCKEQKRGDWAKKKTWYDKALALGFFKRDRKDVRSMLEEAEAKGEYLPLLDDETAFGGLAYEFERHLLPSYFQSKSSEAEGLKGVFRERPEAEEEIFSSEENLISTKKLFQSLIKQVGNENSWIEEKDLPLYLRFAIKRPLMSEPQFCRALEMLDLTLDFRRAGAMSAIDNGPAGLASDKIEEDGSRQFRETRRLLMNVYEIFQDGMIYLEEAHRHYSEILGYTDVDRETLIASLQNYGIPIEQTPGSGQSAAQDAAIQNYPGTGAATLTGSLEQDLPMDNGSMEIIEELSNLIRRYRYRHYTLEEVLTLIYESLAPYKPKKGVIKDYVKGDRDPDDAARNLWEEAVEEDSDDDSDDDDSDDDNDDDSNDNNGKEDDDNGDASDDVEDSEPAHGGQSHPKTHPTGSQALNGHDNENDLELPNDTSTVRGSLVGPPARLLREPQSPLRDAGMQGQRQDTPTLDATAPAAGVAKSRRRRSRTRRKGHSSSAAVSSSRDPILYVQTGSHMPSKQARRLAYNLGLPYDYLRHRVRELLMRVERRRAKRARSPGPSPNSKHKASDAVGQSSFRRSPRLKLSTKPSDLSPKSKRKASDVGGQSSPRKSPRLRLSVKPQDPKEDPGHNSLDRRDVIKSTTPCPTCSDHPCRCAAEPQGLPDLERRCRECQQEPCACIQSLRSPNHDQRADPEEITPSAHIDFNDIGQYSDSPYPVLAYISQIWEAQNLFQSFIRAGFGNTTEAMRTSAYRILAEIGLCINVGVIRDNITQKDVAAVAVLNRLQRGSHHLGGAAAFSTKKDPSRSRPIRAAKATKRSSDDIRRFEDKVSTLQQAKARKLNTNGDTQTGPSDKAHSDLAKSAESSAFTVLNSCPEIAGSQMLIDTGNGILSGKLKTSTERNNTADAVFALHEQVESHHNQEPMESAPNGGSSRSSIHIKSSSSDPYQDPNLVMSHLISSKNDPFILPHLTKLVASAKVSRPEIEWMKTLLDSVPKDMPHSAIKGRFSKQDITVVSKMQEIVKNYSSTVLQNAKENTPPGGIDLNPVPPKLSGSNPVLAYLTRVLRNQNSEDSTLEFIKSLERDPMSANIMGEVVRVRGLIEQGMETRELGRGPQAWKDIVACDILDRLYKKCKPLHAFGRYVDIWTTTEPAREDSIGAGNLGGPKDSNPSSGARAQDLSRDQHSSLSSDIAKGIEGERLDKNAETESLEGLMKLTLSPNDSRSSTNESLQSSGIPGLAEARHSELDGAEHSSASPLTAQPGSYGIPKLASTAAESSRQSPDPPSSPWTTPHEMSIPRDFVAESGFESPEPPPTPRPRAKELPSPINPAAEPSLRDPEPPASPRPRAKEILSSINPVAESNLQGPEPPASPRPRSKELPSSINPVAESSFRSPEPPASPRPRAKELPRFVDATIEPWLRSPEPPPAPQLKAKELARPVVPISKSPSQDSERESLSSKGRPEQPPNSDTFKDMTAEESFEYFQDVAFREQRSFSSVMAERRAIRKRPDEADYRCFPSFFQSSNGGAPNLAATVNKLFDKYRGNLSMPKVTLNIVLNPARRSERRTRQDRCGGFDEVSRRSACQTR